MTGRVLQMSLLALALPAVMTATAAAAGPELRFSITGAVASDPSYEHYKALTAYVAKKAGRSSSFISGLNYEQVDHLFVDGKVDVGFLCNTHFARRRDAIRFEAIAAPVIIGYDKPKFQVYVIVPRDSSRGSWQDLRGASVDLADPLSTTTTYTAYKLLEMHETLASFFGKVIYSGSHDMTVQLVASKVVDAGVVDGHIWDYHDKVQPVFASRTKVIARSPEYTTPPVVVSRSMAPALKEKIRDILLAMHEDAAGREILRSLRIGRFAAVRDRDYDDALETYTCVRDRL